MLQRQNLWILTEEHPKFDVIQTIVGIFCQDRGNSCFVGQIRIIPIIENNNFLSFNSQEKCLGLIYCDNESKEVIECEKEYICQN